jgi:hypothetical protein
MMRLTRLMTLTAGLGAMAAAGMSPALAACTKALAITEAAQMSFGTVGVVSGSGRVTLSPAGAVTAPSGFFLAGAPGAGSFKVTGTNNCAVIISFTSGALTGPGAPMTITNFTTNAGPTPTLTRGGRLTFAVGADLVVNSGQAGGNYSGTYSVTVVY